MSPKQRTRWWIFLILLVMTNVLFYGLLADGNFRPTLQQSNNPDRNICNQSIFSLVSKDTKQFITGTVVPRHVWVEHKVKWHDLQLPIITCKPHGRLGNIMGEYATLYALHLLYNVTVLLHPEMREKLGQVFPYLTIPNIPDKYNDAQWTKTGKIGSIYNFAPIELAASGLLGPHRFQLNDYPFEMQLFHPFKEAVVKEFKLSQNIAAEVEAFLSNIKASWNERTLINPVFIGFHIRRTDYVKHAKTMFGATLPNMQYFQAAMNYYRRKFGNATVFIAASDGRAFLKSKLGSEDDLFLTPDTSPSSDLAILSSCNHSIITMGSFGFWTGYLTGGEVVYPDVQTISEYRFSRQMFEKSGLTFVPLPVT